MKKLIKSISIAILGTTLGIVAQPKYTQLYTTEYKIKPEADLKSNFKVTSKQTNPFETASNYKKTTEIRAENEYSTPVFVEPYASQTGVSAAGNYKGQNGNKNRVVKPTEIYSKPNELDSIATK